MGLNEVVENVWNEKLRIRPLRVGELFLKMFIFW